MDLYKDVGRAYLKYYESDSSMTLETADAIMAYRNAYSMKIFFLSLFMTVSSAPLNLSTLSIVQPSMLNLTTELTDPPDMPIDPRFGISSITYTPDVSLDQKAFLATTTQTMANLALKDFYGQIGSFQNPRVPGYSSISIQFRVTGPAQQIETRIAVWAVFVLVVKMALAGTYQEAKMYIYWDHAEVG